MRASVSYGSICADSPSPRDSTVLCRLILELLLDLGRIFAAAFCSVQGRAVDELLRRNAIDNADATEVPAFDDTFGY